MAVDFVTLLEDKQDARLGGVDKCQNSVKIHNKLWHLCFKFVFISY